MRKTTALGLLTSLLMLPAASLAATEGLVLCHSKQDRPDGQSRIVFGPADAIAELQASEHQLGTLIVQPEPMWAEVPNTLWSLQGRTYVFYDRNLTDRGGVLIGDGGAAMKMSAKKTSGCEVAVPQKVCPNERFLGHSVKCG